MCGGANQISLQIVWEEGRKKIGPCICETEKEPVVTLESTIKLGEEGIGARYKESGN